MYKILQSSIFMFFISFFAYSQEIPNANFETWTNGSPDEWTVFNIPTVATTVTQSTDAHSGSSSAKLEVISVGGSPFPAYMHAGIANLTGFPVTQRYGSLSGFYKFSPLSVNDALYAAVIMYNSGNGIGAGTIIITAAASGYTQFTVPIEYGSEDTPDGASIYFVVADSADEATGTIGTFAIIDDLSFGGPTAVEEEIQSPETFALHQNYPNPFNPSTTISYDIPATSYVELKVYNAIGSEIMTLVNKEQSQGRYTVKMDGTSLSSGIYFYTMKAGSFKQTGKMILQK